MQHTNESEKHSCIYGCRESEYYTQDINSADAAFVYDYCYVQWMIGDMHANERKFPHREVHQGYTALSHLDRSVHTHNVGQSHRCVNVGAVLRPGFSRNVDRQVREASGEGLCLL